MRVLVSAASRHGATEEIARAIADGLQGSGIDVDVRPPGEVETVEPYDAVVLGSAVYMGRWLDPARDLVDRDLTGFRSRPVWLFSSGPVGEPPKPDAEPVDATGIRESIQAIEHRVFAGKVDRQSLGFGEKTVLRMVRAPEGDFRGWDEIRSWARSIAHTLGAAPAAAR